MVRFGVISLLVSLNVSDLTPIRSRTTLLGPPSNTSSLLVIDLARARLFGWRVTTAMRPRLWDLAQNGHALGIHWDIVAEAERAEAATQTFPAHWHALASPVHSASLPTRRPALDCQVDERFYTAGTLFHLDCPTMGVHCTIPCTARQYVWALRLGDSVRGLCTDVVNWNIVTEVAHISAWDLPGTIVHGGHEVWEWPDDLAPLAGQCGHVFQRTSQSKGCHVISYPQPVEPLDINFGGPSGSSVACAAASGLLSRGGLTAVIAWALCGATATAAPLNSSVDGLPPISGVRYDSTQTCNVGWCHELACQSTHLATSTGRLTEYFRSHSPFKTVRVQLWQPFHGPATFDIARDAPAAALENTLAELGHDSDTRLLHVAFDTQATSIDLISAPYGHSAWWIVRDGLSRELLRPVAPWYDEGRHSIVTLNQSRAGQCCCILT